LESRTRLRLCKFEKRSYLIDSPCRDRVGHRGLSLQDFGIFRIYKTTNLNNSPISHSYRKDKNL
jgi:hypothetical protein